MLYFAVLLIEKLIAKQDNHILSQWLLSAIISSPIVVSIVRFQHRVSLRFERKLNVLLMKNCCDIYEVAMTMRGAVAL